MPKMHIASTTRIGYTKCGILDSFRGLTDGTCSRCFSGHYSSTPSTSLSTPLPTTSTYKPYTPSLDVEKAIAKLKAQSEEFQRLLNEGL